MNPIYSILESKYRWPILAGLSFTSGCVGAMWMLAVAWPHGMALAWAHGIARGWLYLGLLLTAFFGVRAFLEWKTAAEAAMDARVEPQSRRRAADTE